MKRVKLFVLFILVNIFVLALVSSAQAQTGEIYGRAVNQFWQTIPGTAVRINATVIPTNPAGEFRFTFVYPGIYTIYYDAPGYAGQTQLVEVKPGQVTRPPTCILSQLGEIYGRVISSTIGRAIPGTAVRINASVVPTNPAGEFRFTLVHSGIYKVYYDAPGYGGQNQIIEVRAGQVTKTPTVILDPKFPGAGEIHGRVVDKQTGKIIPGSSVNIHSTKENTAVDSKYRFTLVYPGKYGVYANAPGYQRGFQWVEVGYGEIVWVPTFEMVKIVTPIPEPTPTPIVSYKVYGLNFGPYTKEGQNPEWGTVVSEKQIKELLTIITPYTKWVRTYGSTHGLEHVGRIGHEMGFKVAIGAWLGRDLTANEKQISSLISIAKAGQVDLLIVGSEVLLRGDLTEAQLINYINRVNQAVPGIPVTTADIYDVFLARPAVISAVDVVFPNYYPAWVGVDVKQAIAWLHQKHLKVVAAAKGKPIIVSETGWPSAGKKRGEAIPSLENASFYFLNFVSWARANNIDYFYFEAFDEPWKGEDTWGPHWGVWDKNGNMKIGMKEVFDGKIVPNNWSGEEIPTGPGDPKIEFTYVPPYGSWGDWLRGQVLHVKPADYGVAVYIKVRGGWWTKPYWSIPVTAIAPDGNWTCNITTGGVDHEATEIVAYLIPIGYNPPLMGGGSTLPIELDVHSVAKISATRTPN